MYVYLIDCCACVSLKKKCFFTDKCAHAQNSLGIHTLKSNMYYYVV